MAVTILSWRSGVGRGITTDLVPFTLGKKKKKIALLHKTLLSFHYIINSIQQLILMCGLPLKRWVAWNNVWGGSSELLTPLTTF